MTVPQILFGTLLALPFGAGAFMARSVRSRPRLALRASLAAALALVILVTLTPADVRIPIAVGRDLAMSPIAQLGIQLVGLALMGLLLSLRDAPEDEREAWLPVAWASVGGLVLALTIASLPLGLLTFAGATLLWSFGLPHELRRSGGEPVLRFSALVSLAMPLLLAAFRVSEMRLTAAPGNQVAIETVVMAVALPGFGLILGIVPLHAWTLTLASGAPRAMLLGVLGLVQTAGFALLLKTISVSPWLTRGDYGGVIVAGGAITAVLGGWLALSADLDDPDDWLAYAVVANAGMLVAGIGTGSRVAGTGVVLLLMARVLAIVLLAMAPAVSGFHKRLAEGAALFTLAGTPLLAGFPGLWLIIDGARSAGGVGHLGLVVGSGMLFASALRRGLPRGDPRLQLVPEPGPNRAVVALVAVILLLGVAPQLVAGALADPLRDIFFPLP